MWRLVLCLSAGLLLLSSDDASEASKQRLAALQPLVGSWRGVAQPQRGSTKGSWSEDAAWSWDFSSPQPALTADLSKGKYFRSFRLKPAAGEREFSLIATPHNAPPVEYAGALDALGQLVLVAQSPAADVPVRITFRFAAANDRLLVLLEKPGATNDAFTRLAEIGYTRQGSGFGKTAVGRECIVTGGLGTIEVAHAGKTYYVCCTGCRDYFQANPEKVLAENAAKHAKK